MNAIPVTHNVESEARGKNVGGQRDLLRDIRIRNTVPLDDTLCVWAICVEMVIWPFRVEFVMTCADRNYPVCHPAAGFV